MKYILITLLLIAVSGCINTIDTDFTDEKGIMWEDSKGCRLAFDGNFNDVQLIRVPCEKIKGNFLWLSNIKETEESCILKVEVKRNGYIVGRRDVDLEIPSCEEYFKLNYKKIEPHLKKYKIIYSSAWR